MAMPNRTHSLALHSLRASSPPYKDWFGRVQAIVGGPTLEWVVLDCVRKQAEQELLAVSASVPALGFSLP